MLLGTAGVAHLAEVDSVAWVAGVLGAFLAFQAGRVKFVFDDEALEVGGVGLGSGGGWAEGSVVGRRELGQIFLFNEEGAGDRWGGSGG